VDLGDAAVLGMAEPADRGGDVEAEFVMRQCETPFLVWSKADAAARAIGISAVAELEMPSDDASECRDRSAGLGGGPERAAA
jgi:hypothetical protein